MRRKIRLSKIRNEMTGIGGVMSAAWRDVNRNGAAWLAVAGVARRREDLRENGIRQLGVKNKLQSKKRLAA